MSRSARWILGAAALAAALLPVVASAAPKIMLLIEEKNLGTIPTSEVEAMAAALLIREEVEVMDQEMVRANIKKDQTLLKMAGDSRGAVALGLQFGADIVVVGDAVAKPSARRIGDSNLRTYQAVVTLRAVNTETAKTLAAVSETASVIGLEDVSGSSKALKSAGKKTLNKLISDMLVEWELSSGATGGPRPAVLSIGGVDKVWKLKAIRSLLRSRADLVQKSTQQSYTAGAAVFEVKTGLEPARLAEQLVLNSPDGLRFQVLEIGDHKINLRAVER